MTSHTSSEPNTELLSGNNPGTIIKRYLLATRPKFLTASILSVIGGTSWGWLHAGQLDLLAALLAILCIAFFHAAANVLNDVFDDINGTDNLNRERIYPYTGGSRFIQNGVLSRTQMRSWALLLLALAIISGIILVALEGVLLLWFGIAGIGLGVLYSAPPVHLASRGLGEFAVAAGFGLLPVTGASWLQTGQLDLAIILLSIPISCWVANILVINEVPDARADQQAGKHTLVVRLGLTGTRRLYIALNGIAAAAVITGYLLQYFSLWSLLLPVAIFILGVVNAAAILQRDDNPAGLRKGIEKTLAMHAIGCLWLTAAIWF